VSEVKVACGGELKAVLGASMRVILDGEGEVTLGDSRMFTLGLAGAGYWVGWRDSGVSEHHKSKIS
jgi:hypothetical protein